MLYNYHIDGLNKTTIMLYLFISLSIITAVLLVIASVRAFNHRKSLMPVGLYAQALRDENSGRYEEAITGYEVILTQCSRIRFQRAFKNKIIRKVKLLHSIVNYNNSFKAGRR